MSTRIYNGWKFAEGTTLEQLFVQFRTQGERMRQLADETARAHILALACETIDEAMAHCMGLDGASEFTALEPGTSPLGAAFSKMLDLKSATNSSHANQVSCAASVTVCVHETGLYAFTNFRNQEMEKAFIQAMPMSEFNYWNNTDEPEGMDPAEWQRRKGVWDDILGDEDTTAHAGAVFQMVRQEDFLPWMAGIETPEVVAPRPLERRVWSIAIDAPQTGVQKAASPGEAHRMMVNLREHPTEEFQALCQKIRSTLPHPIPGAWLRMKREELLATCQARALEENIPSANAGRSGPRI